MDDFDISTNELMKLALAKPLSGSKQIVPLVLPKAQPARSITLLTSITRSKPPDEGHRSATEAANVAAGNKEGTGDGGCR